MLLTPGDSDDRLAATVWVRNEGQLPLLLHRLRQLFGPDCQLRSARRLHTADDMRAALVAQLQFTEARLGGDRGAGGPERRGLRLGDLHVPMAEYGPWRRRLTQLEDNTAACALDLVEPEEAALS
ncbi:uncharacterized protein LOC119113058 [Pollicipes pollicipes]|uniref:uncharacterized protein LOC119113058 n=1 Tax=Pollicipes pollicipes TaxID=41117 RepID=UPI001884C966|nr:uncharacterized protein LOC119113058 [Pollicipes pollicipes]